MMILGACIHAAHAKYSVTDLFQQCAPNVAPETLRTVIAIESSGNPYAIAIVGQRVTTPPKTEKNAIDMTKALEAQGLNYSVGLMQINKSNFARYGLTIDTAFDVCKNLNVGARILESCFMSAKKTASKSDQLALRHALSCYYSGNFTRGYVKENGKSYLDKVENVVSNYSVPKIENLPKDDNAKNKEEVKDKK